MTCLAEGTLCKNALSKGPPLLTLINFEKIHLSYSGFFLRPVTKNATNTEVANKKGSNPGKPLEPLDPDEVLPVLAKAVALDIKHDVPIEASRMVYRALRALELVVVWDEVLEVELMQLPEGKDSLDVLENEILR